MKSSLDKLGSFGALVAAAACPVCFPKLALVGALIGLGGLAAYERKLFIASQVLVGLAVLGHALSFAQHRRRWLLAMAVAGGAAFFLGLYVFSSEWLVYAGLALLVLCSVADIWARMRGRASPPAPSVASHLKGSL